MIAAAQLRRRILAGDTYTVIAADIGMSADALRKRARRLGVSSSAVLGRHRRRPAVPWQDHMRRREERRRPA